MWGETNCQSFEMAAKGFEPDADVLTAALPHSTLRHTVLLCRIVLVVVGDTVIIIMQEW